MHELPSGTLPAVLFDVAALQPPSTPRTVLIVDDETGPREALRLVLKPYFRVFTADGGTAALEILAREDVDAVTLDLRMPGLDGVRTLEQIREVAPDLEVVIVTGYGDKESVMDTIYLGAFSYINKPFHASDVLETIRRACEHRRLDSGISFES